MEPTELLRLVGEQLDRIGCQRFTTGSVASMVFGEPRFTNDIDIVVRMDERQARLLVAAFAGEAWYASADAAVDAARRRGMFNIIHVPSGLKADIIVREGGSQKHLRDIASMIAVQGVASFDWPYLEHWAERLGVAVELDLVRPRP